MVAGKSLESRVEELERREGSGGELVTICWLESEPGQPWWEGEVVRETVVECGSGRRPRQLGEEEAGDE